MSPLLSFCVSRKLSAWMGLYTVGVSSVLDGGHWTLDTVSLYRSSLDISDP